MYSGLSSSPISILVSSFTDGIKPTLWSWAIVSVVCKICKFLTNIKLIQEFNDLILNEVLWIVAEMNFSNCSPDSCCQLDANVSPYCTSVALLCERQISYPVCSKTILGSLGTDLLQSCSSLRAWWCPTKLVHHRIFVISLYTCILSCDH